MCISSFLNFEMNDEYVCRCFVFCVISVEKKPHIFVCFSLAGGDTLQEDSRELSDMKRHSEGTFSNDYSKYLEDRKAQDFVRWLMNNKRSGSVFPLCLCFFLFFFLKTCSYLNFSEKSENLLSLHGDE